MAVTSYPLQNSLSLQQSLELLLDADAECASQATTPIEKDASLSPPSYDPKKKVLYTLDRIVLGFWRCLEKANKSRVMRGNWSPVHKELTVQQLPVIGALPDDLDGAFIRIGPNPYFPPMGDAHWFDGDGVAHVVRIRSGSANYANQFIQTSRLKQEIAAGWPLFLKTSRLRQETAAGWPFFLKLGDLKNIAMGATLMGLINLKRTLNAINDQHGEGTANTAIAYIAGRLMALQEGDLPYQIRVLCSGAIETLTRLDFDGKMGKNVCAHPKTDPLTGDCVWFNYRLDGNASPLTVGFMSKDGQLTHSVPITLPQPIMTHDISLTQDYVVLLDVPLLFSPRELLKGQGLPFVFSKSRGARFGVLKRTATDESEIQWISTEGLMILHVANTWQEGPYVIKMYAVTYMQFTLDFEDLRKASATDDDYCGYLCEFTLDLQQGAVSRRRLSDVPCEFPMINQIKACQPCRYVYAASAAPDDHGDLVGIVKIDLQATSDTTAVAGHITYDPGRYGGEAFFVPARAATTEDAGYLLTYVYDRNTSRSEMVVYDAHSMSEVPVASVQLPARVPYGFHTLHITEEQLQKQLHDA